MNRANRPDEILGYLASLPDAEPPEDLMRRVRAATRPPRARRHRLAGAGSTAGGSVRRNRRLLVAAAASLFALAGLAGSLHLSSAPGTGPATGPRPTRVVSADPDWVHAEIRALDRRLQRRLAEDASDEELRSLWRERAVLAELLEVPANSYHPTRI